MSDSKSHSKSQNNPPLEASFSIIVMSIASSAAMALGLTPNENNETKIDKEIARFNIDLLSVLKNKTQNNLNTDEKNLLDHIIQDLQLKFVQLK